MIVIIIEDIPELAVHAHNMYEENICDNSQRCCIYLRKHEKHIYRYIALGDDFPLPIFRSFLLYNYITGSERCCTAQMGCISFELPLIGLHACVSSHKWTLYRKKLLTSRRLFLTLCQHYYNFTTDSNIPRVFVQQKSHLMNVSTTCMRARSMCSIVSSLIVLLWYLKEIIVLWLNNWWK